MVKIREAVIEDIPKIAEMWAEFLREHDKRVERNERIMPYLKKKEDYKINYENYLRMQFESGKGIVLIAEDRENKEDDQKTKPIGFALAVIKKEIPIFEIGELGCIGDIYVKEEFRGKGLSSQLKDKAIEWFKENGIKHACILLYKDNEQVHSIYKKWGFFDYKIEMRKEI